MLEKEEVRFARTLTVGEVHVTPLVEVKGTLQRHRDERVSGSGSLTPVGILVETPEEAKALDLDGEPLPFEEG